MSDLVLHTFSMSLTVLEIFQKTGLQKSLSGSKGFKDVLILVKICLKCLSSLEIVSSLDSTVGALFPQNWGWGLRFFEPLYLKNVWRNENVHGSIKSSSAPFF